MQRVRRLGWYVSSIGERYGIGWLTYNPVVMQWFHAQAVADAPGVMRALETLFPHAHSYADIGAGSGAFAAEAQRRSRAVVACEHSPIGRLMARRQGVDCRPLDLAKSPPALLGSSFDLAYCFDVAEHLEPALGERLVEFLAQQSPLVVFTAAHPGQGGTGHVNEQPKSYWIAAFERARMHHRPELSQRLRAVFVREGVRSRWLIENAMVFESPCRVPLSAAEPPGCDE